MRSLVIIGVLGLALGTACKQKENSSGEGSRSSTAAAPAASVKPGSHEDWCAEHNVPESLCTQCDSKLIPAFKASGDWCDVHKLPKSHDRECNPSLKLARPPKS